MPTKQRVQTQNRVRAFKPKVKTGCMTCRYITSSATLVSSLLTANPESDESNAMKQNQTAKSAPVQVEDATATLPHNLLQATPSYHQKYHIP